MTSQYWGPAGLESAANDIHGDHDNDKDQSDEYYHQYDHDDEGEEEEEDEGGDNDVYNERTAVGAVTDGLGLDIAYANAKYEDDNDMCRGYGSHTNLDYDRDGGFRAPAATGVAVGAVAVDDDAVPAMPAEFYSNVESFLSRGAPAINDALGKKKTKKKIKKKAAASLKESEVEDDDEDSSGDINLGSYLPKIGSTTGSSKPPPLPTATNATAAATSRQKVAKKYSNGSVSTSSGPNNQINEDLLKEAFAYTDKLLKEALMEEQQQQVALDDRQSGQRPVDNSAGIASANRSKKTKKGTGPSINEQQQQQLTYRSRTQAKSAPSDMEQSATRKKQGSSLNPYKTPVTSAGGKGSGSMVKKLRSKTTQSRSAGGPQFPQSATLNSALQQHEYLRSGGNGGDASAISGSGNGIAATTVAGGRRGKISSAPGFTVEEVGEKDLRRNVLNFDELVSNFQNGTTLQTLQKELEMSKKSMARSEQFLRNLSKEYFS